MITLRATPRPKFRDAAAAAAAAAVAALDAQSDRPLASRHNVSCDGDALSEVVAIGTVVIVPLPLKKGKLKRSDSPPPKKTLRLADPEPPTGTDRLK